MVGEEYFRQYCSPHHPNGVSPVETSATNEAKRLVNEARERLLQGPVHDVIDLLDRATDLTPRSTEAWILKGGCHQSYGNIRAALACYDEAIAIEPMCGDAWKQKGTCYRSYIGDFISADACYDEAITINPADAEAWTKKGSCLAMVNRAGEAIRCYDAALALLPDSASVWKLKGQAHLSLGQNEEGVRCLEKARELEATGEKIRDAGVPVPLPR
jgi:tetratricopeptide (TPR) repeat protein